MLKSNLIITLSLFLFIGQDLLGQSNIAEIDLDDPTEQECYRLDSVLSLPNNFDLNLRVDYFECLGHFLPEYDNYRLGLFYQDSLIQLLQKTNQTSRLADTYYRKSMLHDHLGEYAKALDASQKGLALYTELVDESGIASSYNDIGVIHYYRGEDSLAQHYLNLAGDLFDELNDTSGLAIYYNNLGNVFFEMGNGEKALEMYKQGYEYDIRMDNLEGQTISLCNIGETQTYLKRHVEAEETLQLALVFAEQLGDSWTLTVPLMSLGDLYYKTGDFRSATHVLKRSLKICREIEALAEEIQTTKLLYKIYKEKNDFKNALYYHETLRSLEDTLFNENSERIIEEMEMQYQVEDKQQEIELLNQKSQIDQLKHKQEIEQKQSAQTILIIGLVAIGGILIFIIRSFVQKKKANEALKAQNEIISTKNHEINIAYKQIEEKSNEILDSIKYAKRIQSAILPASAKVQEALPDSFILYLPKDVVAGDFYWLEERDGKTLFAIADCTGHGVPGAMVSVVCNNGLNRSVREYGLTDPGEILDKTRSIVLEEFEKSTEKVNDGMDIALCCLDGNKLTFSGANNPLWIVKKKTGELIEIKGDKQPVGEFEQAKNFTTHEIELDSNDVIYLATDGYADQFGGDKGKKFKTTNFKKFLQSQADLSMNEQDINLSVKFEEWKGELEQIDDVCVAGIRMPE